jgi:hypothetical protein
MQPTLLEENDFGEFERIAFYAARVRNVSKVGSQLLAVLITRGLIDRQFLSH